MRSRAPSSASVLSATSDISFSEIESISSHLDMADIIDYNCSSPKPSPKPSPSIVIYDLPSEEVEPKPDGPSLTIIDDNEQDIIFTPEIASAPSKDRHSLFYCENVILEVEGTLFSIPKAGLTNAGSFFVDLFDNAKCHSHPGSPRKGSSDDHPIVLDGVSKDDFETLLRVIYPMYGITGPTTDKEWLAILHLATEWNLTTIRETALKNLEHLFVSPLSDASPTHDPIRALSLCIKYKITQHVVHQFSHVITSITPLKYNALEAGGISDDIIRLITEMRERWLCGKLWSGHSKSKLVKENMGLLPGRIPAENILEDCLKANETELGWAVLATSDSQDIMSRVLAEDKRIQAVVRELERAERERAELERAEREKTERERAERERAELEREELGRAKREREERVRAKREKKEAKREREECERREREEREIEERERREREEREIEEREKEECERREREEFDREQQGREKLKREGREREEREREELERQEREELERELQEREERGNGIIIDGIYYH